MQHKAVSKKNVSMFIRKNPKPPAFQVCKSEIRNRAFGGFYYQYMCIMINVMIFLDLQKPSIPTRDHEGKNNSSWKYL